MSSLSTLTGLSVESVRLSDFQILVIPGGFSYGDDIAAGKVLANELRLKLGEDDVAGSSTTAGSFWVSATASRCW